MSAKLNLQRWAAICLFVAVAGSTSVIQAQFVSNVNGLFVSQGVFSGFPQSTVTITNNYPTSAVIDQQNLGQEFTFFANRDDLLFSSDGGATRRVFNTTDSFDISVGLTLNATFDLKRKEAGIRINKNGFDGLFIVNSDAHEIAAFGGPLPFYSFNTSNGISYTTGTPITMRMIYNAPVGTPTMGHFNGDYNNDGNVDAADYTIWRDNLGSTATPGLPNDTTANLVSPEDFDVWKANFGSRAGTIEYLVTYAGHSYTSGQIKFGNNELGTLASSQLGVYAQGGADAAHTDDDYNATFTNFAWGNGVVSGAGGGGFVAGQSVPEPATLALAGIGVIGLALLRRRRG